MPLGPVTNFSATPTSGTAPLTVSFTDLSSPPPSSWAWTFGDGGTSTLQNPTHTYTTAGTYTVSLTPSSPYLTEIQTNLITVSPGGTNYTLQPTDCGKETRVTNSTSFTNVHIPTDAEAPGIAVGMVFRVKSIGPSPVTIVNDGVTLNTSASLVLPQYGVAHLIKVGSNQWDMDAVASSVAYLQASTPIKPAPMVVTSSSATALDFGSAAHHNTNFRMSASSAITVTVRADSFWAGSDLYYTNNFNPTNPAPMPAGGSAIFGQVGSGEVTFVADVGVTINTPNTLSINKLNGKVTLIKVSANVWDIEGNLN